MNDSHRQHEPEKRGDQDEKVQPHFHEHGQILAQSGRRRSGLFSSRFLVRSGFFHGRGGIMTVIGQFPSSDLPGRRFRFLQGMRRYRGNPLLDTYIHFR